MPHVLVVEDDDKIAAPLVRTLEREGYTVERVAEGMPAIDRVREQDVDLVLLDLGLPDMDGLDVCRQVRDNGYRGGIIILTARDGELDLVVGLDVGADDYLAKPFGLSVLLARVRALFRRHGIDAGPAAAPATPAPAPTTGVRVDVDARRVWVADTELPVTSKEFDVMALLDSKRGAVISREQLINDIWDENWFGSTKTLDATIGRLRQKLEEVDAPARITTVRGVGFRLEDVPDA
ncbi:chemotaxis protein CheY [Knoellia flava TL1]|uniref:DNA-binding response regulator n=2 Tax=Knoellia flava TaxID=913969 RepID=A0A8H9FWD6_9MICO|nr:response regulator transcription factor [Knoellia flava]KGN35730.1 chemotaxis protein CheY [Knoellia flava TL1]GGB81299.1 DNA-binding response regulator [Knoellia flava]